MTYYVVCPDCGYNKRICYNAPNEIAFTSEKERESCERFLSQTLKREVSFADYEQSIDSETFYKINI